MVRQPLAPSGSAVRGQDKVHRGIFDYNGLTKG